MQKIYVLVFAIVLHASCECVLRDDLKRDVGELLYSIEALLEFVERFYFEMNIDAVLGLVLGQGTVRSKGTARLVSNKLITLQ